MNSTQKAWLKALRSGKYEQAQGLLGRVGDNGILSHCCLGVACEVSSLARRVKVSGNSIIYAFEGGGRSGSGSIAKASRLHERLELGRRVTFTAPNGEPDTTNLMARLIGLNDDDGWDFEQIADYLEETWRGEHDPYPT